jgi:uncharacterized protein YdhG (YjbR/CyaY superfamily)
MRSDATTVNEYLAELPDDRVEALTVVLKALRKKLPEGLEENINWGMIAFEVPLSVYPNTYNGQPIMHTAVASQKNHMAIYMGCLQGDGRGRESFIEDYKATGKRLDIGKGCVRFRKLDDLPVDVIAKYAGAVSIEQLCAIHDEYAATPRK